jgi:hypothetical protein
LRPKLGFQGANLESILQPTNSDGFGVRGRY